MSVSVTEPRFRPGDKALLLAARRAAMEPRGSHGLLLSDATDAANEFVVDKPVRDYAQQALDAKQAEYEKLYGDSVGMQTLLWRVRVNE